MSANTLSITVHFFAMFSELTHQNSIALSIAADTSASDLYHLLAQRYGFPERSDSLRVAINECFADWQTALSESDQIAFIPPVNGG